MTYDLERMQKWLVTGSPIPAALDLHAVAGVVDSALKNALACRQDTLSYWVCGTRIDNFAPSRHFQKLDLCLKKYLSNVKKASPILVDCLCDQQEIRQSFALCVLSMSRVEAHFETLVMPIERYIDSENGASLSHSTIKIDAAVLRQPPV
jgi:hypothetical protein